MKNIFILLLLFLSFSVYAQTWNVKDFSLDDGLSQTQILCLHQDKKGKLWIGTNGGGINIYDGKKFSYFTQKDGLLSDVIYHISEDESGVIYLSTKEGLSVFNGIKFTNFTEKEGLPKGFIFCAYVENKNRIWIGGEKGVVLMEKGKITKPDYIKFFDSIPIWTIKKDKNENLWFGTMQKGVVKITKDKKVVKYTVKDSLFDNRIRNINEFSDGNIIIGTWRGVNIYDAKTGKISKFGPEFPNGSVCISSNDDFWVGRHVGYVTKYKKIEKITYPFIPDYLYRLFYLFKERIDKIYVMIEDREKNIWIGTENGLKMFSQNKAFYNYSESDSLHNNNVTAILHSSNDEYWIGASKHGVIRAAIKSYRFTPLKRYGFYIDKEVREKPGAKKQQAKAPVKEEKHKFDQYISGSTIYHIIEDRNKNIWIATNQGISKYDGNKFYNYSLPAYTTNNYVTFIHPEGLTSERINYIFEDKKGIIWLGTYNGLTQITDSAFVNFNSQNKIFEKTIVWYISQDKKGNLWFCTDKGLIKYDGKTTTLFNEKSGLVDKDVVNIVIDKKDNLWIGTKEGVFIYNGKTFSKIDETNGLASNNIYLLVINADTTIFIATNKGLDVLNIDDYHAGKININHYGKLEGFIGQECYRNASYVDNLNRIWFGTVKGVTIYDPSLFKPNTVPPKSLISKLQLSYKDFDSTLIAKFAEGVDTTTGLPVNLVLPYFNNHITFDFVATSLSIPKKVMYSYILEGLNKDWTPPMPKSEADFPGLSDGTYTFKVRACNDDGIWSDDIATFTFTITPPFWKTWWFYTIVIILIIIGVIFYIKRRERKLIEEKEILEATVKERTAEIQQQKEEIETQRDEIMDKNDVLQQQKEEIQLQAAELEKLSIVASETDNAVMIMDADGTFEWVNEGFTKMYGYTLEQLKLFRGSSIFDSTGNKHLLELIESGEVNKEPIIYESLCHTKSGEKIWAQTTITPVLDENGSIVKLVAIDSNIHQMKLAEEEIRQAKEEIEAQRDEIQEQKNLVDEKNKDITDSINYAKNIQNAILPDISIIQRNFPDTFVLFKPRDIVSGDFYWYNESEQYAYFAAIDCTGHGVPGAFMSMLGFAFLNEIVNKDSVFEPDDILNRLRGLIVKSLHQEGKTTDSKDGMDVVLCVVDKQNNKLYFSGANNPLYLIRNNELNEYKGDKMPIAYHLRMDPFAKLEIEIQKGDTFYFFSDGFADQFGGPKGKKFMYKHLKTLLLEIQEKPMQEQNAFLDTTIEDWKAHIDPDTGHYYEQVDDILIIGLRF